MFMTMDALLGATLSLTLTTMTLPVVVGTARKASSVRKDVVATAVANYCNNALIAEEDLLDSDVKLTKGIDSIDGDCGVSQNDLLVTFKSGDTRTITYDPLDELYTLEELL